MHIHIISRLDAQRIGLKYYFTAKPCKHNHFSLRYTRNSDCVACTIKRAESSTWKTGEELKQYKKEWSLKNKSEIQNRRREYRSIHKARIAKDKKNFYLKNRDKILEQHRINHLNNPEVNRKRAIRWRIENPEKAAALARNKKAKRKLAEGKHYHSDIARLLTEQKWKCANCFCSVKSGYHVDHIMPLALGGTNWPDNLQILCPTCNMRKNAKHPDVWAAENGRLF